MEDKDKPNFDQKKRVKCIREARSKKARDKRKRSEYAKEDKWN